MSTGLPIYEVIDEIRKRLSNCSTVILQAPPGAGKSTVLPLHLLDEPWLNGKKIILLEPRRLAAKAVARRLAESLNESAGETVGYRVRFETNVSSVTRLEIVTEGILTRMLQSDNSLKDVGLVIFDEFHERSLHADLALALCRESQQILREDLRILIMSATLDGEKLSTLLGGAPIVTSRGRQFPIEYRYAEPDASQSIAHNTVRLTLRAFREVPEGDLLVFLPGSGDIHRATMLLEESGIQANIFPLYGDLPQDEQEAALRPDKYGRRKIVLSTSIAETSLTIEGIRAVVDCGYARVPRFDPGTGLTRLETVKVTADTADQRAGRAGRLGPGIAYRLWPERAHHQLTSHRSPEIAQADLSQLVLELSNWGHADVTGMTWLTPPPDSSVKQANELLDQLGAVVDGKITLKGKALLEFPTHPRIAHLLWYGRENLLGGIASDVAAILEERDPLPREAGTDLALRMEVLQRWRKKERVNGDRNVLERLERLSKQWRSLLKVPPANEPVIHEQAGELIAAAYPERIARREATGGRYRLANGRAARLPDHDPLSNESWIAVAQMDAGIGEGKIFLASAYDPAEKLKSITPVEQIAWDEKNGTLVSRREWRIGNLVAKEEKGGIPSSEKIAEILCGFIRREGLHVFNWTKDAEQFLARVESLRKWRPELSLPDCSEEGLTRTLESWAAPFLGSVKRKEDLKRLDLFTMLKSGLSWDMQMQVERLAAEKVVVPSGSAIRLEYFTDGKPPVLAVRLQEVFGLTDSPAVNEGRTNVTLHLLSPGYKPVQITQDLRSFWSNTYHTVRKELKIRYPKHSWPEDPWTAQAVRGVPKR